MPRLASFAAVLLLCLSATHALPFGTRFETSTRSSSSSSRSRLANALSFSAIFSSRQDVELDDEAMAMPSAMPMPSDDIDEEPTDTEVPVPPMSTDPSPSSSPLSSPSSSPSSSASASPSPSPSPMEEEEAMPSPSPETVEDDGSEVCVEAEYLTARGVSAHHLVHKNHITAARVLCPTGLSLPCATPDHMVRVAGVAMSYERYCATTQGVQCTEKKNVLVNSVLSHMWEETPDEHAPGVTLTMLDARHPESMQKMLHRAIAFGRRFVQ